MFGREPLVALVVDDDALAVLDEDAWLLYTSDAADEQCRV
jgi:hypothetical protein